MDTVVIPKEKCAAALAALYNASRPQGLGFLNASEKTMSEEEAAAILADDAYADYVHGRVIKTDFSGGETSLRLFDRDNGKGAAYAALLSAGVID